MADWTDILKGVAVEKNVPLTRRVTKRKSALRDLLDKLEVGDSIFIPTPTDWPPDKPFLPLQNVIRVFPGKKFAERSSADGVRIWRTV